MTSHPWIRTSADVHMPPIIYGTAWKKAQTADWVEMALRAGFRGIDTACQPKHYQEDLVGEGLQRMTDQGVAREAVFLQTKFTPLPGQDPGNIPYDPHAPVAQQVAQSFEVSLTNLKTEYIDSLVLHSPMAPHEVLMEAWGAMERIAEQGGARQLGISNCYHLDMLKTLYGEAEVKPAVVQNRFYREAGYDTSLRRWCKDQEIIYQSFWTLTANPHILASPTVAELSQVYQKTPAQIFFRYLTHSGIVPLTGTCSEQHMREDLSIFEFALSSEDLKRIDLLLDPAV